MLQRLIVVMDTWCHGYSCYGNQTCPNNVLSFLEQTKNTVKYKTMFKRQPISFKCAVSLLLYV